MGFGLVGQQHEIKTDKHSETWESWRLNKQDSRDRADTLTRDLVDKEKKRFARKRLWALGSKRSALHQITFRIRAEMSDKDFWAGSSHTGARHPWHMQAFKGTKLGLMSQAKAWIHKHSRANNHTQAQAPKQGNLLGDNHEINITWVLFQDKAVHTHMLTEDKNGDNYGTT